MAFDRPGARGGRGGGALTERYNFDKRIETEDGYGNTVGTWETQFSRAASRRFFRGVEKVVADAATGTQRAILCVRSCCDTRSIGTDWCATDARTGETYNITAVEPHPDRQWIDLIVISGVANG